VVSIRNHAEVVKALRTFCADQGISSGTIDGLGAVSELELHFFDSRMKRHENTVLRKQMEIADLTGNILMKDGRPFLHMHVTAGRADCSAVAGHLLSATLNGAGEFVRRCLRGLWEVLFQNHRVWGRNSAGGVLNASGSGEEVQAFRASGNPTPPSRCFGCRSMVV